MAKKTRSQIGKMSRSKGKTFEREISKVLRERKFDARRGRQFKGTNDSPDIISEALSEFHIEAKARENLNLWDTYSQCLKEAPEKMPLIVWKRNRKVPLAVLELHDFIDVLQFAKGILDGLNKGKVRIYDQRSGKYREYRECGQYEKGNVRENEGNGPDSSCPSDLL